MVFPYCPVQGDSRPPHNSVGLILLSSGLVDIPTLIAFLLPEGAQGLCFVEVAVGAFGSRGCLLAPVDRIVRILERLYHM